MPTQTSAPKTESSANDPVPRTTVHTSAAKRSTTTLTEKLNLFHINIQCLKNKTNELEIYFSETFNLYKIHYDILCFSEHWCLHDEIETLKIQGYILGNSFSRSQRSHGGVAIFVRENIDYIALDKITKLSQEQVCELSAVKIVNLDIILIVVYRPPNSCFNDFLGVLEQLFHYIKIINKKIVITGDFNVHFNTTSINHVKFNDFIVSFGFNSLIREPTRGKNCLDNFMINFDNALNTFYAVETYLADHKAIVLNLTLSTNVRNVKKVINYKPISQVGLNTLYNNVSVIEWNFVYDATLNIDDKFDMY